MVVFSSWFKDNWFSLLQTVGILGSLWFTAGSFRQASKATQVSNLLTLEEWHRSLWSQASEQEDLKRIFLPDIDLKAQPASIAETEFLRLVMIRFETGWKLKFLMDRSELKVLALDIGEFLSLPLPRAVWEMTKQYRNHRFVRFVKRALKTA